MSAKRLYREDGKTVTAVAAVEAMDDTEQTVLLFLLVLLYDGTSKIAVRYK